MRPSRDQILSAYRAHAQKLGRAPGRQVFCNATGFTDADIEYYWPRFGDLTAEAGSSRNTAPLQIPEEVLFSDYARVCLHLGKIPTRPELRIAQRNLGTRTHKVYQRFGSIGEFDARFRTWLAGQPELSAILDLPGWDRKTFLSSKSARTTATEIAFHPFLPASLQYLDALAQGSLPPNEVSDSSPSLLFERRCADAFQALGFEVRQLGQGKGRTADILALARRDGFALIVDAKAHKSGYVVGTEDRKFIEYAATHAQELGHEGIERIYFVVVAAGFQSSDRDKLSHRMAGAQIRGFALITARALIRFVEESIGERWRFSLGDFEKALFGNPVITR